MKNTDQVKFLNNGIKVEGIYIKGYLSIGNSKDAEEITFYAHEYGHNKVLNKYFNVINNTEIQTDYFENDHFTISTDSAFYISALKAIIKKNESYIARSRKYISKNPIGYKSEYKREFIKTTREQNKKYALYLTQINK